LRVFLQDIRNLETIAEITEEISNLADAILEYALRLARQELDNRYGNPLETDAKQRKTQAKFCIVALGKLGSKELNYSSDIDLLFLYSSEGKTSGNGSRGSVTNREYFVKLAEFIIRLVGGQTGEGAAYRVDMRLRPHGRVGALAICAKDAVRYYKQTAQAWERQVLIRSRASAGDAEIFQSFFENVKDFVFSKNETVENALENVRLSKEKINLEKNTDTGFNVKLGTGGIREIEFIAQALQLAYGGNDEWLRAPHTLISLSRLADRKLISGTEVTELFEAYYFLRKLEHRLQMEHGLQTHLVTNIDDSRLPIARKMNFSDLESFDNALEFHTTNVHRAFHRVFSTKTSSGNVANFSEISVESQAFETQVSDFKFEIPSKQSAIFKTILDSFEKSELDFQIEAGKLSTLDILAEVSPHFATMITANPSLINSLPTSQNIYKEKNYQQILLSEVEKESNFALQIAVLRKTWSRMLLEIAVFDIFEKISQTDSKKLQTKLAEASLETAIIITKKELEKRFSIKIDDFPFAVLGLGKLGGCGIDYGSDLDLVLIFDNFHNQKIKQLSTFFAKAVEIFVTVLSAMTRDGSLYRVDLRLRPDGKNGATSISKSAFLNYLAERAAIWEWLAYVKIRGVAGDLALADSVAKEARKIIHQNALEADEKELKTETWRVREQLKLQKSPTRKGKETDIKFGEGGMLDVYFAMRFLQLRDNVPDAPENRSTAFMLKKLYKNRSLGHKDFKNLSRSYSFLSELDHNLRLTVGRSTRLPISNQTALQIICRRMNLASVRELHETLTFHRLNTRASFEHILND
jgi:glutamate-ammonia-ligase adenylyltransferase